MNWFHHGSRNMNSNYQWKPLGTDHENCRASTKNDKNIAFLCKILVDINWWKTKNIDAQNAISMIRKYCCDWISWSLQEFGLHFKDSQLRFRYQRLRWNCWKDFFPFFRTIPGSSSTPVPARSFRPAAQSPCNRECCVLCARNLATVSASWGTTQNQNKFMWKLKSHPCPVKSGHT